MSQPSPNHLPIIPLDQSGLHTIDSVIKGYLPHLARKHPVPRRTIAILRSIRGKLAPLLKPGGFPEGTTLPLTREEMQALAIALQGFSTLLLRRVAPSEERDATIAELARFHHYLDSLLSLSSGIMFSP